MEIVSVTKLICTIIENDLTWNANTSNLVKRANARMVLLRKLSEFGAPTNDLRTIYITYIRSVLEQSAVVWHTSLTQQNMQDLSRVQKTACKIILRNKCHDYMKSLESLNLEPLHERRDMLCKMFALKSARNASIPFKLIDKSKHIQTRSTDKYEITFCNTERLKKSAVPQMERLLNHLQQPTI